MSQVTGIVQEVNNRGLAKGSNIVVNGQKYGCYDPVKTGIDMLAAGQEVTFASSVKGQYTNIDGRVTTTGGSGPVVAPTPTPQGGGAGKAQGGGNPEFQFPIPPLNYQRSVCRRESLAAAVAAVAAMNHTMDDIPAENLVEKILEVAGVFEEYTCGDDITKQAEAAMAALGQSMPTQ